MRAPYTATLTPTGQPADAMDDHWHELADAVLARLARLVEGRSEPDVRAGVLECVAALGQLHQHVAAERQRHRPVGS